MGDPTCHSEFFQMVFPFEIWHVLKISLSLVVVHISYLWPNKYNTWMCIRDSKWFTIFIQPTQSISYKTYEPYMTDWIISIALPTKRCLVDHRPHIVFWIQIGTNILRGLSPNIIQI